LLGNFESHDAWKALGSILASTKQQRACNCQGV